MLLNKIFKSRCEQLSTYLHNKGIQEISFNWYKLFQNILSKFHYVGFSET
jgi:hypothetical protein